MDKLNITAIVPCYNREKTIIRCVDSILSQCKQGDKIIIVDDCSKDNSVQVIKNKYEKNEFVEIIINYKNMGVSTARNRAIEKTNTKLVTFIDSDDYISEGYLDNMRQQFENANTQVVITGFTYVDEVSGITNEVLPNDVEGTLENRIIGIDEQGMLSSCCNKVYLTDIIKSNNILYNTKAKMMEDYEFNLEYFKYIKNEGMKVIKTSWYNYIHHGNDSASSRYQESLYDRYKEIKALREKFYSKEVNKQVFKLNVSFLLLCLNNLYKENDLTNKQRQQILKDIMNKEEFKIWQKEEIKQGVFQKIIYYATMTNKVALSDIMLKTMHKVKGSSKVITKLFRKINKK